MSDLTKQFYSGTDVLNLASKLAETAATLATDQGITPIDARLALELASRISVNKKETPAILAKRLADAITHIRAIQTYNPTIEKHLEKLISAADALVDEL